MRQVRNFRSKKEFVYDTLRAAILEGELGPGSRLVIDELSRELGVSQIPVREALQQLQADGFVTIEPYVGATITEIDVGLVCEIFDLLESLEVISGRMACRQMTDEDLDEMGAFLRNMDALVDDPDSFSQENARLHQFICDRAGTPLVKGLMAMVLAHWDRLRHHYLNAVFVYRLNAAQREHWRILEALRTRDVGHVERVIREHNRAARAAYEEHLRIGSAGTRD
ncbi:MAG: GntR family transcriptional regulator [Thermoflexales bacterium]|nr:GntR family transcriptional regulator [Thermoflexales bacterium]